MKVEINSYFVKTGHLHGLPSDDDGVVVSRIKQRSGEYLWFIKMASLVEGPVLNRDLEWEYNSLPSARRDEELQRTRYASVEEALGVIKMLVEKEANMTDIKH
jgi:hypothetical protein